MFIHGCRHTSRFLLWWLTGFPFAAWACYGWVTPLITAVVTFLLLGVENIGIQIEEPFEVLPLEAITAGCAASVQDMLDSHLGKRSNMCACICFAAATWAASGDRDLL